MADTKKELTRNMNICFKATAQDKLDFKEKAKEKDISVSEFCYSAVQLYTNQIDTIEDLREKNEYLSKELSKAKNHNANLILQSKTANNNCQHVTEKYEILEKSNLNYQETTQLLKKERDYYKKKSLQLESKYNKVCNNIDNYVKSKSGYSIGLIDITEDKEILKLKD